MLNLKLWGPYGWYLFHTITYTYQKEFEDKYNNFFKLASEIIPCLECQSHFQKHLIKYPPPTNNDKDLTNWLVDMHNRVNRFLKKKEYSLEEAGELYFVGKTVAINHQYIHDFITIVFGSNVDPVKFILFLQTLSYIFPCRICSRVLVNLIENSYLKKIINGQLNPKFVKEYLKLIKEHKTDETILQKQLFNPHPMERSITEKNVKGEDENEVYTEDEWENKKYLKMQIRNIKNKAIMSKYTTRATKLWKKK